MSLLRREICGTSSACLAASPASPPPSPSPSNLAAACTAYHFLASFGAFVSAASDRLRLSVLPATAPEGVQDSWRPSPANPTGPRDESTLATSEVLALVVHGEMPRRHSPEPAAHLPRPRGPKIPSLARSDNATPWSGPMMTCLESHMTGRRRRTSKNNSVNNPTTSG